MHFGDLLERIAKTLEAASISYMIIGGQAVLVHGEPRLTKDIDVTLGIPPFDPKPLLRIVEGLSLKVLVSDVEQFLKETFVLPTLDPTTGIRVDLICSLSEYEKGALTRAIEIQFGDSKVRFIGVEDLIIHKVIAGRPRDLEDAKVIMLKHSSLDCEFIRHWLQAHDAELGTNFKLQFDTLQDQVRK